MAVHRTLAPKAQGGPAPTVGSTLVPVQRTVSTEASSRDLDSGLSEPSLWRVLGRELVKKTLPSPARAATLLSSFLSAASAAHAKTNEVAAGAIEVHRMDLLPLALMIAARVFVARRVRIERHAELPT